MAGVITAGLRLVSFADTSGVQKFTKAIRDLRVNLLGFDQLAGIFRAFGQGLVSTAKGIVSALGSTIEKAVKLDAVMTNVAALGGSKLGFTVDDLRERFILLSNQMPIAAEQLAETAVAATRAGITNRAAVETLAVVSGKLAAISDNLSAGEASKQLLTIANNMDLVGKNGEKLAPNIEHLADMLALMDEAGIASAQSIAEVSTRASGAARNFKLTSDQLMILATFALNTGASAEVAGTAIAGLLTTLSAHSAKAAAGANLSAAAFRKMIDEGHGLKAVQKFVAGVAVNADGSQRSATQLSEALTKLGFDGRRLGNMVSLLVKNIDQLSALEGKAGKATGALDKKFNIFASSMEANIQVVENAFSNLQAQFGLVLKPVLAAVATILVPILEAFQRLPAFVKFGVVAFLALSAAALAVIGVLSILVAGLAMVIASTVFLAGTVARGVETYSAFQIEINRTTRALNMQAAATARLAALQRVPAFGARPGALAAARAKEAARIANINKGLGGLRDKGPFSFFAEAIARLKMGQPLGQLTAVGGPLGAVASALGQVATFLAPVISGFSQLGAVLAGLGLTKVLLIIGAVFAVLIALQPELDAVVGAFFALIAPIGDFIMKLGAMIQKVTGASSALGALLFPIRVLLFPVILILRGVAMELQLLGSFLSGFFDAVLAKIQPIVDVIQRFKAGIEAILKALHETAVELGFASDEMSGFETVMWFVHEAAGVLFEPFLATFDLLRIVLEGVLGVVFGLFEAIARELKPIADDIFAIELAFSQAWNEIVLAFKPITDAFSELSAALGLSLGEWDLFGIVVQGTVAILRPFIKILTFLVRAVLVPIANTLKGVILALKILRAVFAPIIFVISMVINGIRMLLEHFGFIGDEAISMSDRIKFAFEAMGEALIFPFTLLKGAAEILASPITGSIGIGVPSMQSGGVTTGPTMAKLHANEAVIPLARLPEVARSIPQPVSTGGSRRESAATSRASGGAPASVSLTIPVTVMLEEMVLGRAVAHVDEEDIRREFGSRGIRLAGVG